MVGFKRRDKDRQVRFRSNSFKLCCRGFALGGFVFFFLDQMAIFSPRLNALVLSAGLHVF